MQAIRHLHKPAQLALLVLLVAGAVAIAYFSVFIPVAKGMLLPAALIGATAVILIVYRYQWGLAVLFFISIFMFYIQRTFQTDFPFGVVYDFLVMVMFGAMLLTNKEKLDWSNFFNPITIMFLLMIGYHLIQVFNPMGTKLAWLVSLRRNVLFILYLLFLQVSLHKKHLRYFMKIWLSMAVIVALYGIHQEVFGLSEAELRWIYADPDRVSIYLVWGELRNFSFLSDPSAYGIFTAFSALACMVLAIRSSGKTRFWYGLMALVILVGLSFSGTRTGYAMIAVGMLFYIVLTMRSARSMMMLVSIGVVAAVIFFGPFHGWQVNRIRSAFMPSEDASMGVRDDKRIRYQPFVRSHPFGGGVYTTAFFGLSYAPGHPFAGFDPDSGYLETAMESGWIGLVLLMGFVFVVTAVGVDRFFQVKDPEVKTIVLTVLVPFFAATVAHYAQNALFAKPVDLLVMAALAILAQARELDRRNGTTSSSSQSIVQSKSELEA
ncbi:O-antigen ligase family protein [Marinoscillum furvescens]|uniref:O-antigen ligase-like membrane protein n=1 Tax=Marinoscillum furvescens DSM 4134 TaxID=1122208 RepID=A0A3D9L199_MARFU|nr:O-antigen ligase family protein [Marinoscillum furvescens]RED97070.1 O-antigen ligase-like membrane protein [Marinoscillum furvescens DSM 4134]